MTKSAINIRLGRLSKLLLIALLMFPLLLIGTSAQACVFCNIHNYLTESVCSSSNIVVGKLVGPGASSGARVEVIRVLLGPFRPGQVVQMPAWIENEGIGKRFIFSDSDDEPSYSMLTPDFEDEISFLLELQQLEMKSINGKADFRWVKHISPKTLGSYKVNNISEAIRRVQGMSNDSKEVGTKYLQTCHRAPVNEIIAAIEQRKRKGFARQETFTLTSRLGNLVEALMWYQSPDIDAYVLKQVKSFTEEPAGDVDWVKVSSFASARGVWLAELLGLTGNQWTHQPFAGYQPPRKNHPHLAARLKTTLTNALSQLQGLALAEAVCALCDTRAADAKELLSINEHSLKNDEFALGVLWASYVRIRSGTAKNVVRELGNLVAVNDFVKHPGLAHDIEELLTSAKRAAEYIKEKQEKHP